MDYTFSSGLLSIFTPDAAKILTSAVLFVVGFFFNEIYTQGLIAVVILLVIDTITGVSASYYENSEVTSKRFSRSIFKGIAFLTAISAGHFADVSIPFTFIESTMIGFVATNEFVSILENIGRHGFNTPKKLLNQLTNKY